MCIYIYVISYQYTYIILSLQPVLNKLYIYIYISPTCISENCYSVEPILICKFSVNHSLEKLSNGLHSQPYYALTKFTTKKKICLKKLSRHVSTDSKLFYNN